MSRTSFVTASIVLAAIGIAACGEDDAIVGGACKAGLSVCGTVCLDLASDSKNCGSCDRPCPSNDACHSGVCFEESTDGAANDAKSEASGADGASDGPTDGSQTTGDGGMSGPGDGASNIGLDGAGGDGSPPNDATVPPVDANSGNPDACTPPFDTPEHCGTCDNACTGATPDCTQSDGGFACTPTCVAPLVDCGSGTCIDLTSDPFNCGACNVVCPSQLCRSSLCVGGLPGSLVYIGNDYAKPPSSTPQARVLSNAVFAAGGTTFEVLAYERYADANATASAASILSAAAMRIGHTLDLTVTNTDADIPAKLTATRYDSLLVFDQAGAVTGGLAALGASWAATLAAFTQAGGVVVVLDGGSGTGEMPAFATGTGLLNVVAHAPVPPGSELDVLIPSDVVGVGVITPYGAGPHTVAITTEPSAANVEYVVAPNVDAGVLGPVVVHKVF